MHKILERQLRRLQATLAAAPSIQVWKEFLGQVDRAYQQGDQDRYLLERSLAISSKEMQDLHNEDRRQATLALNLSEGRYRSLFENAIDSIFIIDAATGRILDVNQVASDRLGYSRAELLSMTTDEIDLSGDADTYAKLIPKLLDKGSLVFERTHVRKDGSSFPVEISSKMLDLDNSLIIQSFVHDITDRKKAERELTRLATHDALTGLPNRTLFDDRLSHAVTLGKRNKRLLAVLFVDLDGFKAVNDAFGHKQGDKLLQTIAQRLLGAVRQSDTVARLGGDEFAFLIEALSNETEVVTVVEKIIHAVSQPFTVHNAEAFITASVGVSMFPLDGTDPDTLIQNADQAMYLSKAEDKNSFRFFKPAMKTLALERLELGNQLRQAIERADFYLVYQPQVDSRTGQVVAVEALVRWNHPDLGLLLPDVFIPLAEETGLIAAFSDLILETACREFVALAIAETKLRLAVNLSHRDLMQPNLVAKVTQVLKTSGLRPDLLELELSENTIFRDMDQSRGVLEQLKGLGVRLAIDDFGVGSSTLSQLARLPFDTLKIDRQFATQLASSPGEAAIVKGIVTIANSLGVEVVAEGVENVAQLEFYESLGCYLIQGWLFAQAVPAAELKSLLTKRFPRP